MIFNSQELLNDLVKRIYLNIERCEKLKNIPLNILNKKESSESWSTLECIEHLNLYDQFYIPEITKKIEGSYFTTSTYFKSGWLGNYFALSMLANKKGIRKIKTFKDKNPANSKLDITSIDNFIIGQKNMLKLIEKARKINLQKTKTNISISKIIKLRLGDTLRFVIYHYERHIIQAEKASMNN